MINAMTPHRAKQIWGYWEKLFYPTSVLRVRREEGIRTKTKGKPQEVPMCMSQEHTCAPAPINITSIKETGYIES